MAYILDSSALITPFLEPQSSSLAVARGWSRDTAESKLKQFLEDGITSGLLKIAKEVHDEVTRKDDPAANLLKSLQGRYEPLNPDPDTFTHVRDVVQFVQDHYKSEYWEKFSQGADPYLLAYARQHGLILVTQESNGIPAYGQKFQGQPKLPFLAFVFKVECIPLMTLLTREMKEVLR